MKLKYTAFALIGASLLGLEACDLNEKFYSSVTPETFITTPENTYAIMSRPFSGCIYNHRTTKTNQKYPSVNL